MRKLRVILNNAPIYPLEVQLKKKNQKRIPPSSEMLDLFQRWRLKDIKEKNHIFV